MSRQHFETLLDADPHDWDTRFVYADWLEEHGEDEAANGQRWQAENEKAPAFKSAKQYHDQRWDWYASYHIRGDGSPLPREVLPNFAHPLFEPFATRQAAESALAERLEEMRVEQLTKQ